VAVILAFVLVVLSGSGGAGRGQPPGAALRSPAPADVVRGVTGVSAATADAVGAPDGVSGPRVLTGQPGLRVDGKPGVLYIGAEYCPYCAADTWAMVVALSRFGTFGNLQLTTSSAWDVYPSTATFSFYGSTFTSTLIGFETVEAATTDTNGAGTRRTLETPTPGQRALWSRYAAQFGTPQGFPFLDIGNRFFLLGAAYDPSLLSGMDQRAIAAKLSNPDDPVTRAVVGAANYLTAALCAETGGQPGPVCTAAGTTAAARALGLG
jgi:hypothetical protein